ncbi:MAG: TonB-dependent receptor [Ignavibacteriae bacterium]|jgi:hypothetical protein|nr:TonB-dependent receptor [Ignavibacteriota bacterium]NOG96345.1 TonB-dependent receptor [Ignavibacteriota bacterium]
MSNKTTASHLLFILFAVLLFFNASFTKAQTNGSLRGFVKDSTNGEALAFGNVYIEELNTGASTNERGYFFIGGIPGGLNYTLVVSYVGYQQKTIKNVFVEKNKITHLDIMLAPSSFELQTIEKVGEKVIETNATDIGLQRIAIKELETLPKGVETDIFRSLQYMPGVRSTGDVSARYYVRGGSSNQNLVLLNGATVYNPFHALGLFSVIDPEMINNIEFYKGGFTAEYGGRLSSVLDINTKDGNKFNFGAKFSSSYLTGKALIEGPIPGGSFLATGRVSYSNTVLKKFLNNQNLPIDFYDGSFKVNIDNPLIPNGKIELFGFVSKDNLDNNDPFSEDFTWDNNIFGMQWVQVYDSPLYSTVRIHHSSFSGEVIANLSNVKPRKNDLSDFTMSLDFTYIQNSKDELGLGLQIKTITTNLFLENSAGAITNIEEFGGSIGLFAKYKFLRFENFGIDVGSRFNLVSFTPGGEFTFEPRVSFTYRPISWLAVKGAWGVYLQEVTTVSDENEIISLFEPWIITPDYLEPQKAIHYVLGVEMDIFESLNFEVEGYYKDIVNLTAINEMKEVASDPDLVTGIGESYGWEFSLKYNKDPFSFTTSYSLSWAYKEVEQRVYYPRYDSRHTLNLLFEVNIGSGWKASAIWNYSTGIPFTELTGFYDKLYFTDFSNLNNNAYDYLPFSLLGDRNLGRLPDYHRLDLSVSKKLQIFFLNAYLDFSIINVYDRKNIFYFKRDTGERVNMLPFLPTATIKIEL